MEDSKVLPIVFSVKNNNDFEVSNVEIFNPKKNARMEGIEIKSLIPQKTMQDVYDFLNDPISRNRMIFNRMCVKCLSVEIPKEKYTCEGKQCPLLAEKLSMEARIDACSSKINLFLGVVYNIDIYPPYPIQGTDKTLRDIDLEQYKEGGVIFDATTKIVVDSIPPLTEMRYTLYFANK